MRFKNLEAEFTRTGQTIESIAKSLNYDRSTLYNRLSGKTNFTLDDMLNIQKFVNDNTNPKCTLDYLFTREEK